MAALSLALLAPPGLAAQRADTTASPDLGFTITCTECVLQRTHHEFTAPPTVIAVRKRSPAAGAGLQVGDRITHVGEIDIRTPEGGDLFGHRPRGGLLRLTIERGVRLLDLEIRIPRTGDARPPG